MVKKSIYNILLRTGLIQLILLIFVFAASSQIRVCEGEEIILRVTEFRGSIQWEKSRNNIDWVVIDNEIKDSLIVVVSDTVFFRAAITEGECPTIFSEVSSIFVDPKINIEFTEIDTVCFNSDYFTITGGSPEGGSYSGPGVIDGRFIPGFIGEGKHKITYTYQAPGSICSYSVSTEVVVLPPPTLAFAGNDSTAIVLDSVALNANIPETGTGFWSIISGENGRFNDITDPKTIFRGNYGEYILKWTIFSECETTSDTVRLQFIEVSGIPCPGIPCPGIPIVTDINGNTYKTVLIGQQCWMAENLKTGQYVQSNYNNRGHSDVSNNGIIEKYCYENDTSNCNLYGGLYDWNELMNYGSTPGSKGICPDGWHIPTKDEWDKLSDFYTYFLAGAEIKVGGSSGFNARLAGDRHAFGDFFGFDATGYFWTSTSYDSNQSWFKEVAGCNEYIAVIKANKQTGMSVRCVKDN